MLAEGGSAADAAVAAGLASCVAETVMTGLLGGGHAIYYDGAARRARNLDCFVAVPGLGGEPAAAEPLELEVPFGTELVHYTVGIASCGVPGLPAGLGALHAEYGRLPWSRVCEPALRLARAGVDFPPEHAACLRMLAPVMTMNEGARIYAPGGDLLPAGGRLEQPGLARALELLAAEGPARPTPAPSAEALLELVDQRGGLVTREDLLAYETRWSEPVEVALLGHALPHARRAFADTRDDCPPTAAPRPRRAGAGARARPRAGRPPRGSGSHHEHLGRRRRGQRLRPDFEPGPRLRRLLTAARPSSEQHAGRDRPHSRRARARETGWTA